MVRFLARNRTYFLTGAFILVFIFSLISNIPGWVLSDQIEKYSGQRLKIYDTRGTFWEGNGLLVALDQKHKNASPLLYINWDISLGFTHFIGMKFKLGNKEIANVYLDKKGITIDKVDISLAITQVSQLFGPLKDLNVSGNIKITTNHININKKMEGIAKVDLENVSSGLSKVNPLGSYTIEFNTSNGNIDVHSSPGVALSLNGQGTLNGGLTLSARVDEAKKEDMLQFITIMGIPNPDGSYRLKIF